MDVVSMSGCSLHHYMAMYMLVQDPFATGPRCMCQVLHATGSTCTRSYIFGPTGKWLLLVLLLKLLVLLLVLLLLLNVNVHAGALFITL